MKKLSRIALLAAASAFMLAVFPACGDDGDDPSVEITGEKTVKMGETLGLPAMNPSRRSPRIPTTRQRRTSRRLRKARRQSR
ncbi:MAG: hypothetical protein K2N31_05720 [Treponemataceae bacterium]|nr:hypothetical protein [Treponemataceae bacterium]